MMSHWTILFLEFQFCLFAFGLFYWSAVSKMNHYRWKRIYILSAVVMLLMIPNFHYTVVESTAPLDVTIDLGAILNSVEAGDAIVEPENQLSVQTFNYTSLLSYVILLLLGFGLVPHLRCQMDISKN